MRAPLLRAPLPTSARIALALLVVLLATSGPALAQAFGRVIFTVKDGEGNPMPDVKLVVTTAENNSFRLEETTNKRGRATFGFADATKVYDVTISHPDYPEGTVQVKPVVRDTLEREITLGGGGMGPTAGTSDEGGGVVFTPIERTFNRGVEALRADDHATAEAEFRAALEMNENYAPAWSALAGLLVQAERYDDALVAAERYRELDPESPRAYRLVYEAHKGLGNDEKAKLALDRLADLDRGGDTAAMLYNEALASLKIGDQATAKPLLQQALAVKPDLQPALTALALAHVLDEEWAEAAAVAERLLALDPSHQQALRVTYDAYTKLGDTAKAEAAFAALAKVDPTTAAAGFVEAGDAAFEAGQMEAAVENLTKVVELQPENARAHYKLGLAYVNLERNANALQHLKRFVELAPDDPEAATAQAMLDYLE